ncbi:hypothetical protein ACFL0M_06570 [Thermodesulfobacteriota bacterium]
MIRNPYVKNILSALALLLHPDINRAFLNDSYAPRRGNIGYKVTNVRLVTFKEGHGAGI